MKIGTRINSEVVILGGGPAAIEAALTAKRYTNDITIISEKPVGDWSKLGISNIILEQIGLGLHKKAPKGWLDWQQVKEQAIERLTRWSEDMERLLDKHQIQIIRGRGEILAPDKLQVTAQSDGNIQELRFQKLFLAVGNSPVFPPDLAPDHRQVFSPDTITSLSRLSQSMLVIGDGPISLEYATIFNAFGVEVTWLAPEGGPNYMLGKELNANVTARLERRGIKIAGGPFVQEIIREEGRIKALREDGTCYEAEQAFLSIGFLSNVGRAGIAQTGARFDERGWVQHNEFGQTSVKNIYVLGDARYANNTALAMKQGRFAVQQAFGENVNPNLLHSTPATFGRYPQIAFAGMIEADESSTFSVVFPANLRHFKAYMLSEKAGSSGLVKIIWDKSSKIAGAVIIGEGAAEMLTPFALAIHFGKSVHELADFFAPHPSLTELAFILCRELQIEMIPKLNIE